VTIDRSPVGLVSLYADLGRQLSAYEREADAFAALTSTAVARVPGAEWASITRGRNGTFVTLAATDPDAERLDRIQYDLGTGPCVDAILEDTTFATGDLVTDGRWPEFARRATEATEVRSMLSFRLFVENDDLIAGLNLYATRAHAFDEGGELIGTVLATHGALAVAAAGARERAAGMQRALLSNRDIGVAMGVLMATYKITREQAFSLLRVVSQNSNRKLHDVAADVAETGTLDLSLVAPVGRKEQPPRHR
jgi:ANTAR domain/GAF domain